MYSLIELLHNTYAKFPNNIACEDENDSCTYKELWDDACSIAEFIYSHIGTKKVVPIFTKKSVNTLKLIWGIILSGNCYSMIDPAFPKDRIETIIEVLNVDYVFSDSKSKKDKISKYRYYTVEEAMYEKKEKRDEWKEYFNIIGSSPAYIMFTSGTTGTPKGVVVSHESVCDFITCFCNLFGIEATDVIGNQAPWDFDISVKDIFSATYKGAKIQIIPKKLFSLPAELVNYIEAKKVTTLIWAVSALCIISTSGAIQKATFKSINKVIFSGEVMPISQLKIWMNKCTQASFINVYGPTEITCNCTYYRITNDNLGDYIPIGKAFPNEKVFLLDENDQVIDGNNISDEGEICVSGTCVSLGYFNNTEETQKKFIQNPLNRLYREIIYRTGDVARYDVNGNLIFNGRKDFQIKYMGHRIELGEIEKAINQYEGVFQNCCMFYDETIFDFYCGEATIDSIRMYLRNKLPSYMIPRKIMKLENLPLNSHGKIDRNKLKEMVEENYD